MEGAEQVLVVVLSGFLALFLILSIVVLILVIKILRHMKRISEKAEQIAEKAEAVGDFFKATAGPVAIGKLLSNIVETVLKKHAKKSKEE